MSARGTAVLRRVARAILGIDDSAGDESKQLHAKCACAAFGRSGVPIAREITRPVVIIVTVQYVAL